MAKKSKGMKCAFKNCKNKHKNTSGYCVEHAAHADRPIVHVPTHTRACSRPMLHEEKGNGRD